VRLVHDHETEVAQWREDRRPGADGEAHLTAGQTPVGRETLSGGESRVEDGDGRTGEALPDARHRLSSEPDLGHQEQHRAAAGEDGFGRSQIDLGLAAPRHPVQ